MRFFIYIFLLWAIAFQVMGQNIAPDRTEYDCDGNAQNAYKIMAMGKPLLVAVTNAECTGCKSRLNELEAFSIQNQEEVHVWLAIQTPNCKGVNALLQELGIQQLFAFSDAGLSWASAKVTAAKYWVIHPQTREVVYNGTSLAEAKNAALSLAQVTGKAKPWVQTPEIEAFPNPFDDNFRVNLSINNPGNVVIKMYNLLGKEVMRTVRSVMAGNNAIAVTPPADLPGGLYFLNIEVNGKSHTLKIKKA